MTQALITGFGPFPRVPRNPSQVLVERLERTVAGVTLHRRVLPTEYRAAGPLIESWLGELRPDLCLCIGVGRAGPPRLESLARNRIAAGIADHSGFVPRATTVLDGGPPSYGATLPLAPIRAALAAQGHDVALSADAGMYVCNYVFYTARHFLERTRRATACGFLHIPALDPARDEGRQLAALAEAVRIIVTAGAAAAANVAPGPRPDGRRRGPRRRRHVPDDGGAKTR